MVYPRLVFSLSSRIHRFSSFTHTPQLNIAHNRTGPASLGDGHHPNPGATLWLDEVQQAQLLQMIRGSAPDGGLWNGRKVADDLGEVLGRPISRQQGWESLKQMGLRLRVPRPMHQESDLMSNRGGKAQLAIASAS